MEADVPVLTGLTSAELIALVQSTTEEKCALAFAADCRLAMRWRLLNTTFPMSCLYEFVVISPGDPMPEGKGWEIWEDHSGVAIGRPL